VQTGQRKDASADENHCLSVCKSHLQVFTLEMTGSTCHPTPSYLCCLLSDITTPRGVLTDLPDGHEPKHIVVGLILCNAPDA